MRLINTTTFYPRWLSTLVTVLILQGCAAPVADEAVEPEASKPAVEKPTSLIGQWCREKKRRITRYTVSEGNLKIISGRSGRRYESELSCNEAYTVCEGKTIRGWGSPVTEILHLDGYNMQLSRVWGGAWKGKTYNFTYMICPKW